MTLEDTRRLGMEFERRVQTMIPEKQFLEKLDTETIYSFLNQYQDRYIHDIYRNLDNVVSGSKLSAHIESVLQAMLTTVEIKIDDHGVDAQDYTTSIQDENGVSIVDTARSVVYKLPANYYMYVRSVSQVSSTYNFKGSNTEGFNRIRVIPNQLVSQSDIWKIVETPYDSLRILRYPAAAITPFTDGFKKATQFEDVYINDTKKYPTLTVLYDQYTTPEGVKVTYYKQPAKFSLMTSVACELPIDAFEELVSGAVDLYVQYAAGAEARRKQMLKEQQQRNNPSRSKKDEDDEE